ncbi:MAG: BrnT family toxin [Alphaproteobacteria bacterium]|nr:BrnT family toxin [Alphaproteobacteria bacterium]
MYEWDEAKNQTNIAKHGVGFMVARRIFEGFVLSYPDTRMDYGEVRCRAIGKVEGVVCLAVIHTHRGDIIRLISARRANCAERAAYEEALRQRTDA